MKRQLIRAERGQSLVEMTVGLVILTIIVSGLLDLGRIWYIFIALEDAVGEAALYLSLDPFCLQETDERPDGSPCSDPGNGMFRASYAVAPDVIIWENVSTCLFIRSGPTLNLIGCDDEIPASEVRPLISVGDEITVEMHYPFTLLSPFVPRVSGVNPITLSSRAAQRVIRIYRDER